MLVYQNMGTAKLNFNKLESKIEHINSNVSKLDLLFEIVPNENSYNLTFEFCTELFKKSTIKLMLEHYINILKELSLNSNISLGDIEILSEKEKSKILYEFNNTKAEYQEEKTIHELFEEQVKIHPNDIAVVSNGKQLTYKELNEKANNLAHYLKEKYKIQDNDIIALMTTRTIELTIGQIAILKTGGCYLPIDPNYPKDRIEYMLQNSKTKVVLTNLEQLNINDIGSNIVNICLGNREIYNNENIKNLKCGNSKNLCYVIYTSGSTGKPKGVALTHDNANNFILGANKKVEFKGKTIVSVTTMSFDIFFVESILSLVKGLKIVLANEDEQNIPELLNKLCLENNVNIIQTTPSRYGLLLSDNKNVEYLRNMTDIICGGEPMTENLLSKLKGISKAKIYNIYGPTETTVWSAVNDLTEKTKITIGKPIANTNIYILNTNKKLLPIGAIGEIYIGGKGVGKGYLYNTELTNEKFIKNPYDKNEIIYATGDLGKWLPNGEIQCLGRSDNQIKIAGNRVELSEIERVILTMNSILNAVVLLKTDTSNRQYICAYIVSNNRIKYSDFREYISKFLPNYMIPSHLIQLDNIPYTPNGKVNKLALPEPENINSEEHKYNPPVTELQNQLVKLYEKLLPVTPIGINDNFFEIGGDSLLAMQLQIQLLNMGKKITYADIYGNPTISELEQVIINSDIFQGIEKRNEIDYNNFENILENNLNMPNLITKKEIGNILLTGVTGYLGSHILEYFINNNKGNVYCIIRREPGRTPEEKLLQTLKYYFGGKYVDLINKRIFIVESDFTKPNLGISEKKYNELSNEISWVINSAAKVTHFGNYREFEKINVGGTKSLIEFCMKFNKKLFHVSTMSVSGNGFADTNSILPEFKHEYIYTEKDFYIKQSLENVYVRTKFEAEAIILDSITKGLDAYIGRMGNLTNRYIDGKFQQNIKENAFMNRIKAFSYIDAIPESLKNGYLEFTPIDKAAEAIITLMEYSNKENRIFHIYNNKHIYLEEFINILKELYNKDIKMVNEDEFYNLLERLLKDSTAKRMIQGIISDFNENEKLVYESNIKLNCNFTIEYLKRCNFIWPEIKKEYLQKVFNYLNEEKFIKL